MSVRYVTLDDGTPVRVIESGGAPGRDDAILLVHGLGGCVYSFAEMIPALVTAGHRMVALDLPGHGLSGKPRDASRYSTRALTDAVLAVANATGLRRFTLVGHSMGGSLGLELAGRGEPRLERLVLITSVGLGSVPVITPMRLLSPIVSPVMHRFLTRGVIELVLRIAFGTRERPTERDIDEYWAPTQFEGFAWACRACVRHATWRRAAATKLRSLRLPVLVIAAGRDRIVRGVASRARLIPGARIVNIREGGHIVLQECAVRTNEELQQFLRRNAPS